MLKIIGKVVTDIANDPLLEFAFAVLIVMFVATATIVFATVTNIGVDMSKAWITVKVCLWLIAASGVYVLLSELVGVKTMLAKISNDIHQGGTLAVIWLSSYLVILCLLLVIYKLNYAQNADALLAIMAICALVIIISVFRLAVKNYLSART